MTDEKRDKQYDIEQNDKNSSQFYRLAPFIREYIYRNNWTELRAIQNEACRIIFDTDDHLLLSSGTASGKTEAAFLPVLTLEKLDPSLSCGILYIAPMKALINDQFYRLDGLLKEAGIPVWHWHGDVSRSEKGKMLLKPSGVLQITPESLESMLINRSRDLVRIFGDLRFIIIDEVHAFMSSDRGIQVLCQLERLQRHMRTEPRRIGLSATLGDCMAAERWLASGTKRAVATPRCWSAPQKVRLAVEHFMMPELEGDADPLNDPSWKYLYEKSLGHKCIIFGNGREVAESVTANLRYYAAIKGTPDIYHVHHGSIAAQLREEAETELKEGEGPLVTSATVTLELGVDIGKLDRVIQAGAPISVSSLVQRLGRSGRRGNPAEMWFIDWESDQGKDPPVPFRFPWRLVHIIAMLQLYLEERWMEPPKLLKYPLSMLYHQIMSAVASSGELSSSALASRVLGMSCFRDVSEDDFRDLVQHLLELDHLEFARDTAASAEGSLIIGLEGEKITGGYDFFAVFPDEEEWAVINETVKIGSIEDPVPPGEFITVGGRCWQVSAVDNARRIVFVNSTKRKIRFFWHGDRAIVHNRILQRMKKVFFEDDLYPYLQEMAIGRLREGRELARSCGLDRFNIVDAEPGLCVIYPWMGHVDYHALVHILRFSCGYKLGIQRIAGSHPYFITVKLTGGGAKELLEAIKDAFAQRGGLGPDPDIFIGIPEVRVLKKQFEYKTPKYDRYIPERLLKKQIIKDYVDIPGISGEIYGWKSV